MLGISPSLQARIVERMAVEDRGYETECWISNRARQPNGYTKIGYQGRTWLTHRFAYTVFKGAVPDELQLDHLCRERSCCNPDHLEPVTPLENGLRSPIHTTTLSRTRTHCFRGHEMTAENIYCRPDRPFGSRSCKKCRRIVSERSRLASAGLAS